MNYIIFDLEYNQQHPDDINPSEPKPPLLFEIIQIGAIKLTKDLKAISVFNSLVKPNIHLKLHPYVENLTKINMDDLNKSPNFKSVYNDFINFIGKEENSLVVWGSSDIKELIKNIEFYNLDSSKISNKYIDIQSYASKLFKLPKGQKISLKNAVEALNIPVEGEFHDAFFDAHYTAEVFKSIYTKKLSPSTFIKSTEKRPKVKKEKLDSQALIKEFEKIYNRKMSKEEVKMIRLAYFMGKTKQFILNDE
ncbi:MAG: 3'-5' exonuclease [Clostridium celatum]|nr:exonuclease domain-containing protein [Clostridium celatum]MDU2121006.1 3'-5' exonuclease [Clostridium celatum]MDU4978486.1 3'-5' exonuclease [Clostridium celatum]